MSRVRIAIFGAAVLCVLSVTGCSNVTPTTAIASTNTPTQKAQSLAPSPTPTAQVTSTPVAIPEALKPLQLDTLDQFKQASEQEKLTYFSYLTHNGAVQYASEYYAITQNPVDKYPLSVSSENTPQEILTIADYNVRLAFSQPAQLDGQKMLLTVLKNADQSPAYPIWEKRIETPPYIAEDAKFMAVSDSVASSVATNAPAVQSDPSGEKYIDISWTGTAQDLNGKSSSESGTTRTYLVEYTDYLGSPAATWIYQ